MVRAYSPEGGSGAGSPRWHHCARLWWGGPTTMVSETRGGLLLRGGVRWESHLGRSSVVGMFKRWRTTVRPRLQATVTAPTRSMGPSAPAFLRTVAAKPRWAPSTVALAQGSLKRFGDGYGLMGNNGSVLGSGKGSLVEVYIGENLWRTDRGLLQLTLPRIRAWFHDFVRILLGIKLVWVWIQNPMPRVESDPTSTIPRSSARRATPAWHGHGAGVAPWMASTVGGVSAAQGTRMGSMANGPVLGCSRETTSWAEPNRYSGCVQGKGK
jgi:hypothetical protein